MTTRLHVADDGAVTVQQWPANQTGRCVRCGVAARVYGPHGSPLCADCGPVVKARAAAMAAQLPAPEAG